MTYKETGNNIEKNQTPALPHTLMQYDVLFVFLNIWVCIWLAVARVMMLSIYLSYSI